MIGNLAKEYPQHKRGIQRFVLHVILVPFCLLVLFAYMLGVRPNVSDSLPLGLYIPAAQGPLVTICPTGPVAEMIDTRGYRSWGITCPQMREALLKAIAAYPGDLVAVTDQGVSINGKPWPHSRALAGDSKGRPLPIFRRTLRVHPGMLWVMGIHLNSFDSRYFGEIPATWVADRLRAFWVWH
jgi:conjugative transfer signal peptidase TraF